METLMIYSFVHLVLHFCISLILNFVNYVEAIKNGDQLVFRQVFDQYHYKLYSFLVSKSCSEYVSDEIVQLTFIKLWESRHTLNEEYSISTQIFRIATTTLIDFLRKQSTGGATVRISDTFAADPGIDSTIQHINEKELRQRIDHAISDMPPVRKQVFEMSRTQGLSHKEIADSLSISSKTVETHITKAIKQIKKRLKFDIGS